MTTPGAAAAGYLASEEQVYRYPGAGDPTPPGGAKVLLLTRYGMCIIGTWPTLSAIGWAPLPKRDREKEVGL